MMRDPASPALTLPEGFASRPPAPSDLDAVLALYVACELADTGDQLIAREDLATDWARPGFDLARNAILVVEGERVVAEAECFRGRVEAKVHPGVRGRGIGTWLLHEIEELARAAGDRTTRQTIPDGATDTVTLLLAHGYEVGHTAWILQIALEERPVEPAPPRGVVIRGFVPGQEDQAVYRVIEDAFNEWAGRQPASFEDWAAVSIARRDFDPALLQVAVVEEEIVGACVGLDYADEGGWVHQLAVEASHRRHGIARALLLRAFVMFWERGDRTCSLSTDSRTGALSLYERVGMHVKSSYTSYDKTL